MVLCQCVSTEAIPKSLLIESYSFIDQDMFMRFRGGAVGHKTMREETKCLLHDHDKLDEVPFELEYK